MEGVERLVLTALDEIAWVTNLRGSDIDYNPVFFSYLVIDMDSAVLFIDAAKITDQVAQHLDGIYEIRPYDEITEYLAADYDGDSKVGH